MTRWGVLILALDVAGLGLFDLLQILFESACSKIPPPS